MITEYGWEVLRKIDPAKARPSQLKAMREYHGFTLREAAKLLEVPPAMLADWEAGRVHPRVDEDYLYAIRGLYGCGEPA